MRTAILISGLLIASRLDRKDSEQLSDTVWAFICFLFVCFVIMDAIDFIGGL